MRLRLTTPHVIGDTVAVSSPVGLLVALYFSILILCLPRQIFSPAMYRPVGDVAGRAC